MSLEQAELMADRDLRKMEEECKPSRQVEPQNFSLEIIDDFGLLGGDKGTGYYLSTQLQTILEQLPEGCRVIIKRLTGQDTL